MQLSSSCFATGVVNFDETRGLFSYLLAARDVGKFSKSSKKGILNVAPGEIVYF
jgi:hypothetical protein